MSPELCRLAPRKCLLPPIAETRLHDGISGPFPSPIAKPFPPPPIFALPPMTQQRRVAPFQRPSPSFQLIFDCVARLFPDYFRRRAPRARAARRCRRPRIAAFPMRLFLSSLSGAARKMFQATISQPRDKACRSYAKLSPSTTLLGDISHRESPSRLATRARHFHFTRACAHRLERIGFSRHCRVDTAGCWRSMEPSAPADWPAPRSVT